MKVKIQIQLATQTCNNTTQKPPLDRRKVLLFILMLTVPVSLWSALHFFNDSATVQIDQSILTPHKVVESNKQLKFKRQLEIPSVATSYDNEEVAPLVTAVDNNEQISTLATLAVVNESEIIAATPPDSAQEVAATPNVKGLSVIEERYSESSHFSKKISRTVLTSGIVDREPVDDLGAEINGNAHKKLYFFSETQSMSGQQIVHRWLLNDRVMANIKLSIGGERWRTNSSKTITPLMNGHWRIEVTDSAGQLLTAHNFDYYH